MHCMRPATRHSAWGRGRGRVLLPIGLHSCLAASTKETIVIAAIAAAPVLERSMLNNRQHPRIRLLRLESTPFSLLCSLFASALASLICSCRFLSSTDTLQYSAQGRYRYLTYTDLHLLNRATLSRQLLFTASQAASTPFAIHIHKTNKQTRKSTPGLLVLPFCFAYQDRLISTSAFAHLSPSISYKPVLQVYASEASPTIHHLSPNSSRPLIILSFSVSTGIGKNKKRLFLLCQKSVPEKKNFTQAQGTHKIRVIVAWYYRDIVEPGVDSVSPSLYFVALRPLNLLTKKRLRVSAFGWLSINQITTTKPVIRANSFHHLLSLIFSSPFHQPPPPLSTLF